MGFFKPPKIVMPQVPEVKPLPEIPEMKTDAGDEESKNIKKMKGRKSTILTGNSGDLSLAELDTPTLLGGN